jgi:transposase-like protein
VIIVSCPYCYKACYVVVGGVKKHAQNLPCSNCRRTFVIKIKARRGKSNKVDAECFRLEQIEGGSANQ